MIYKVDKLFLIGEIDTLRFIRFNEEIVVGLFIWGEEYFTVCIKIFWGVINFKVQLTFKATYKIMIFIYLWEKLLWTMFLSFIKYKTRSNWLKKWINFSK